MSFLTLLPVSPQTKVATKVISNSVAYFPIVAFLFSTLSFICIYFNEYFSNYWIMAILIMISHALLSGGLHLDALMDSHDGLACSDRSREEILRVMKDSRAGAFAVISIVFVLIAQLLFISQSLYNEYLYLYLLVFVPVFSRIFLVIELVFFTDSKRLDSKSSLIVFAEANKIKAIIISLVVIGLIHYFYPLTKICILVFVILALVFSIIFYRFLDYKLKGKNGDSMGCGLVINETFMYLLIFIFSNI